MHYILAAEHIVQLDSPSEGINLAQTRARVALSQLMNTTRPFSAPRYLTDLGLRKFKDPKLLFNFILAAAGDLLDKYSSKIPTISWKHLQ